MRVRCVKAVAAGATCAGMLVLGTAAPSLLGVALADDDGGAAPVVGSPAPADAVPPPAPADQPPFEPLAAEGPSVTVPADALPVPGDAIPVPAGATPVPADMTPLPGGTTHALADDATAAPAGVAAAVLVPGMNPAFLTINPDGSLVSHGTTPVGVETPGWSVIAAADGIDMVHGPAGPAPDATPPAAAEGVPAAPAADVSP